MVLAEAMFPPLRRQHEKANKTLSSIIALAFAGLLAVSLAAALKPAPALAAAGINKNINYQGRLLTNSGAVVADGNYNLRFKVYQDGPGNVSGDTGGTLMWT